MLYTFAVSGYRSLRELILPLERLNIITGANGSGKSSFYRSLKLLSDVAQGRVISSLAAEGGLGSTLWAGPEEITHRMRTGEVEVQGTPRRDRVSLKLGFSSEDYGYAIDLGLPIGGRFGRDPEIKREAVWTGDMLSRRNEFAARHGRVITVLGSDGSRGVVNRELETFDSMMTHAADPISAPELLALRERMRRWRFYDHFRTDKDAPARRSHVGTRTPVLSSDGADLAAALETIKEIGDPIALATTIEDGFPGSSIEVLENDGVFEVTMRQRGLLRPLRVAELSDGTLRYLLLAAALLTPRPPELMVLNEPETSLHPDLLEPLGRLIEKASKKSQLIVVSHAKPLVQALKKVEQSVVFDLGKELGETVTQGVESPRWAWPKR